MALSPGTRIGTYEILAPIGAGGMGEVYCATDNKLNRKVALKFLPLNLTRKETAKARFVQEAQAASSLDHPSICTIFDIGETEEGQLYLAMALYEGGTLRERLEPAPLKIDEALEITIQVALGLGKAHASGIVHRDLKPANLMFTADGQIKIVDFGLVKLLGEIGLTEAGMTLGTVAYMSPEQVQGKEVDERTDIWSLGVVLYEMVTGQLPFKRGHQKAMTTAITDDIPPPMRSLRSDVPKELDRVLRRALAKDRDYRYQTVSDFVSELRWLKKESERSRAPTSRRAIAVSIVVALLAGVGLSMLFDRQTAVDGRLVFTNPTQVTTALGVEDDPAWSPDGRTLAYSASSRGEVYAGNWDIWLVQLGGGPPVNRTAEHQGADRYPSWSPDGRQIAFWSDRDGGGYFVMSALGGAPRKLSAVSGSGARASSPLRSRDGISGARPEWSPDGTELAVSGVTETLGPFVEIVSLSSGRSRQVPLPGRPDGRRFDLTWSPDGRHFAYVDAAGPTSQVTRLWVLHLDDKTAHPVTDGLTNDWTSGWSSDGRNLYFVSSRGGTMDLWRQPMDRDGTPSGTPARLTTAVEMRQARISPDGNKLAYSRGRRIANLWRLPILPGRTATWADAEQLTFDQALVEHFDVSGDGERVLVSSDRGGNPDIWMMPSSGGEMQQLTATPTPDWAPAWSPDGKEFAFYSFRGGNRDIWSMALDGGTAQQITRNEATDWYPDWSPDGQEIVFWSERSGNSDIWSIDATGGDAVQITRHPKDDIHPQWSSSGEWLMFTSNRDDDNRLWRVPVAGGAPEALTAGPARMGRLSSDGQEVFFVGWAERAGEIWSVSIQDGFERQVTNLVGRQGTLSANALAVDSRYLYFSWEQDLGDIWVMDVVSDQ